MITIVPATPELLAQTRVGKPPMTMRALVAIDEAGKPMAVAGLYTDRHRLVLFSDLCDELRQNKRALIRGVRMMMDIARAKKAPVHAVADPEIPGSVTLLKHMGFIHLTGDLYAWRS
jgi:hypothetical protein